MDNAQLAMQYFQSQGWTPAQAAAIVGNLQQESYARLDPAAMRANDAGPGNHSMGLAQWNRERLGALRDFAKQQGKPWNDFQTQLEFVQHELTGTESRVGKALKSAGDVNAATAAFVGYERPQGWSLKNPTGAHGWENRLANASALYGNGAPAYSAGPGRGSMAGYKKAGGWVPGRSDPSSYEAGHWAPDVEKTFYDDRSPMLPGNQGQGVGASLGGFSGGMSQVAARNPNIQNAAISGTGDMRPTNFQRNAARQAMEGDQSQRARLLQAAGLDPTGKTRVSPRGTSDSSLGGILDKLKAGVTGNTGPGLDAKLAAIPQNLQGGLDGGILGKLFNLFK
jgi:hypothetical protein